MPAAPRRKRLLTYANVRARIGQIRDEASASADPTLKKLFEGTRRGLRARRQVLFIPASYASASWLERTAGGG